MQWYANIFFRFLNNTRYKLSLGCNASDFLMKYFQKLIKNSCNANKNLKKLHLEAKLSNLRMALVPFKNLLQFLQKKCSKHLKIDQKDMSRVAKFVSHDGILLGKSVNEPLTYALQNLITEESVKT